MKGGSETWKAGDLQAWRDRCGLSLGDAATVLGLSRSSVARNLSGGHRVGPQTESTAKAFEAARQQPASDWVDGDSFADACEAVPTGVIGLISAAVCHGITSQIPPYVWVSVQARTRCPNHDGIRTVPFLDVRTAIEHRPTADGGRFYRVTSLPRTLLDLAVSPHLVGMTVVDEAFVNAINLGVTMWDVLAVADAIGDGIGKDKVASAFVRVANSVLD